jgi:hypothetical protein
LRANACARTSSWHNPRASTLPPATLAYAAIAHTTTARTALARTTIAHAAIAYATFARAAIRATRRGRGARRNAGDDSRNRRHHRIQLPLDRQKIAPLRQHPVIRVEHPQIHA